MSVREAGLVELAPGDDRRTRIVSISGRGVAALERARPLWRDAQGRVLDELGEATVGDLLAIARAVTGLAPD